MIYNITNKYKITEIMEKVIEMIRTFQEDYWISVKHETNINYLIKEIKDKKRKPSRNETVELIKYFRKIKKKIKKRIRKIENEASFFNKHHRKNRLTF